MKIESYTRQTLKGIRTKSAHDTTQNSTFSAFVEDLGRHETSVSSLGFGTTQALSKILNTKDALDNQERKRRYRQAKELLIHLEGFQISLLTGESPKQILNALEEITQNDLEDLNDPLLQDIFTQIRVRIAILETQLKQFLKSL